MPPDSCSHPVGLTNNSSRARRSATPRTGSFDASCGKPKPVASMKPRCEMRCASVASACPTSSATHTASRPERIVGVDLLATQCQDGEIVVLQGYVVLQLVERQSRAAPAHNVGNLDLLRSPDSLHVLDAGVVQPAYDGILDVILDARGRIVVLADPED